MQISLEKIAGKQEIVQIKDNDGVLEIYPSYVSTMGGVSSATVQVYTASNDLSQTLKKGESLIITSPGEFEHKGIFVSAQVNMTGQDDSALDLVETETSGITVVYYSSAKELNRDLLAQLGVVHVLILEVQSDFTQQIKAVTAFDPQVLIPVPAAGVDLAKFKQEIGIVFTPESKFKAKITDFTAEEYVVRGVELQ